MPQLASAKVSFANATPHALCCDIVADASKPRSQERSGSRARSIQFHLITRLSRNKMDSTCQDKKTHAIFKCCQPSSLHDTRKSTSSGLRPNLGPALDRPRKASVTYALVADLHSNFEPTIASRWPTWTWPVLLSGVPQQ